MSRNQKALFVIAMGVAVGVLGYFLVMKVWLPNMMGPTEINFSSLFRFIYSTL
ncbi:hypothetical protein ABC345_09690 [Shouchella sp. 1P09AA]|uniref:hypothetical protein n=1 Tax=unclassified Shouchella TaxID=2893065 RepID=UPI0039A28371